MLPFVMHISTCRLVEIFCHLKNFVYCVGLGFLIDQELSFDV